MPQRRTARDGDPHGAGGKPDVRPVATTKESGESAAARRAGTRAALCVTNYGMLKFWKTKGDGKTWAEERADECVRLRRKQVADVDANVFAGMH